MLEARGKTMSTSDPRIDQYIAKAPSFAKPILSEVRARVRQAVPEAEETIKWNVPFFVYAGKLLASMAAFKKHAKIGVWGGDRPTMIDVITIADLPDASAFRNDVKTAAKRIDGESTPGTRAGSARTKAVATKAGAKKVAAKKSAVKNAPKKRTTPNAKSISKRAGAKKTASAKSRKSSK